jgi:hypothetical protein
MGKLIIIFFHFIILGFSANSQLTNLGSWNIVNIRYKINEKWSAFGEAQLRSLQFYNNFHYYEYKGGVNFKAHKNVTLTIAAGDYNTYREGGNFKTPMNNDELRIWPQVLLTQSINRLLVEQRYRSEFRFTSNGYRTRFRYRLGLQYPFGNDKKGYKPLLISVNNELFFGTKEPYFERNRIATNLQYKISSSTSLMLGLLHQFDYKINDEIGRTFFQSGIYLSY